MVIRGICRTLLAVGALVLAAAVQAQEQSQVIEPTQKSVFEEMIRNYILANPEVLIESLQIYEQNKRLAADKAARQMVTQRWEDLSNAPGSPVLGNPDGDVQIVEFFDYRCSYCITVAQQLRVAVQTDGKIRLIMKEYPILGADSAYAARVALAAAKQGQYERLHFAMMTVKGKVTKASAMELARRLNLDMDLLARDMESKEIDEEIQKNYELASSLGIRGTPTFVIGDRVVKGAIQMPDLRKLVDEIRANSS